MKPITFVKLAMFASLVILPFGSVSAASPNQAGKASEANGRLKALEAKLEALDWYSKDEPLNVKFSLTNPNTESVWVLRWQIPSDEIDTHLFQVTRNGQPVNYRGPLVKRADPDGEDYLEIKGGETFAVLFDPSAVYEIGAQGDYALRYRVNQLDVRTQAPEAKSVEDLPMLALRNPQAAKKLDTLPGHKVHVEGNTAVNLWYEGQPEQVQMFVKGVEPMYAIGVYTACTTSQQTAIQTALTNATALSNTAAVHLAANSGGSGQYTTYFGAYSTSRFNTVKDHFSAIYSAFKNQRFDFDCKSKKSYYAYVYPTQPYKIYFGKAMWTAPALGQDSKAGVLIHETSHFTVVAGTNDYVYGLTGAKSLALNYPDKAINNADNHEYFAELLLP